MVQHLHKQASLETTVARLLASLNSGVPLLQLGALLKGIFAFLMLGGASLLVLVFCVLLTIPEFICQPIIRTLLQMSTGWTLGFVILFSYPHFIWSYRFAYQQGRLFIMRHAVALVFSPLLIGASLLSCIALWNTPTSAAPALLSAGKSMGAIGVDLGWSNYNTCGQLLLATILIVQTTLSGHHYIMQAYGVAVACGQERRYVLAVWQKRAILANLYLLWAMNVLSGYRFFSVLNNGKFVYYPPAFPHGLFVIACVGFAVTTGLVLAALFYPALRGKRQPPWLLLLPIAAVWAWLQPFMQPYGFQAWVVPIAHGAQYLYFAARTDARGFTKPIKPQIGQFHIAAVFIVVALCGYFAFLQIPVALDETCMNKDISPKFFLLAFFLFLNIHHYFIDSIVWKSDSRAKQLLAGQPFAQNASSA